MAEQILIFTVVASEVDVPEAPLALSGTRISATIVNLSWIHDGDLEDGFTIERKLESAIDFEEIGQAMVNATTYEDVTIESNESYHYRVAAFNATGTSVYTNVVSINAVQETDILAFSLAEQTGSALIYSGIHTVSLEVEFGTDVTSLTPGITLSEGATSAPVSSVAVDFTEPVTYTVTSEDGSSSQDWQVTVTISTTVLVTGITLNENQGSVAVDSTYSLIASLIPANATNQNVIWSSDNQAVARVDSEGIVLGITVGTAVILATTEDGGFTDTFEVTVTEGGIILNSAVIQGDEISIYPNPVSDLLYTNIKAVKVEVISLVGNSKEMKVIQGVIDVSKLTKGLYFIKTPQQQFVRFIKK